MCSQVVRAKLSVLAIIYAVAVATNMRVAARMSDWCFSTCDLNAMIGRTLQTILCATTYISLAQHNAHESAAEEQVPFE